MNAVQQFLNSPAGYAIVALLLGALADFITGTAAAIRDGTYAPEVTAAWLRRHVAGRVVPLTAMLAVGYYAGAAVPSGSDAANLLGVLALAINGTAVAGAGAYVAELIASIRGNLAPPKDRDLHAEQAHAVAVGNPIPND